jgi:hypothetical protein
MEQDKFNYFFKCFEDALKKTFAQLVEVDLNNCDGGFW